MFPNLPKGPKYLVVEAHTSPNCNETGDFTFLYNLQGPQPANIPIPGAFIAQTKNSDVRRSAFIVNQTALDESYFILLMDAVRTNDNIRDQVHVDYLATCGCP